MKGPVRLSIFLSDIGQLWSLKTRTSTFLCKSFEALKLWNVRSGSLQLNYITLTNAL